MKTELKQCTYCGRQNWGEHTTCRWCMRRLPANWEIAVYRIAVVIIALVSIATIASVIIYKYAGIG